MVTEPERQPPTVYVDADACPVKEETYRVAGRNQLPVVLVANSWMRTPLESWIRLEVVKEGFDAADDWIVEAVSAHDIVVTADIPLAARLVEKRTSVLTPSGRELSEDNVSDALATRDLLTELRSGGVQTGGPAPMDKRARSRFLQELDRIVQRAKRSLRSAGNPLGRS